MQDISEPQLARSPSAPPTAYARTAWVAPLVIVILTFVFIAPTLMWIEFSGGSENLNVATVLEIRREHRWLLPTLQGEPRVAKPPLTAWITAGVVDDDTIAAMTSLDPAVRARAERALAWQVRWPFLLSSCLMLLATAELGRVLGSGGGNNRGDGDRDAGDWRIGVVAAAVCASNLFFLRHGRMATTDVQLALWVALANVCLAHAVMRGRWWRGAIGAGFFLGLAFMSKGPVALVQSVAPLAVFLLWERWMVRRRDRHLSSVAPPDVQASVVTRRAMQLFVAIALFTLVALPWYAIVAWKNPNVWSLWQSEVTREGATDLPPGHWYAYISLFAFIMPWTAFFIAGMAVIVRDASSRSLGRGMMLALMMVVVPIVAMSFFRDRKERYLLPMIVPASVVIARAVVEHFRTRHEGNAADRAVVSIHWTILLVIAIGLPVAGVVSLKTIEGARWFSPALAGVAGAIGLAVVVAGIVAHRRWSGAIVAATLLLMLGFQVLFMHGYRNSREGRSEMKPLATMILEQAPDASLYTSGTKRMRAPSDLSVYLNRPVPWVDEASQIPPSDRPAVLVVRQREHESPPLPPPGMTSIGKTSRSESWWHAFLMPNPNKKD